MSKPVEASRPSGTAAPPPTAAATAAVGQPPKTRPAVGSINAKLPMKGPPPNAVLIKTAKTPLSHPSSASTSTTISPPGNGSRASFSEGTAPPAPALVPAQCWYANAFTLSTNTPMTEFHRSMRGKVFFSPRAVPVTASELLLLPGERPPQLTICEVGKDLLYGMAYLYNTPLSIEHQWRGRVAHLLRVRSRQAPIPGVVRRRAEAVAALQRQEQEKASARAQGEKSAKPSKAPSTSAGPSTVSQSAGGAAAPVDYERTMRFERGEAAVYDRPADDLLMGVKLFVNDELVEDHYPIVNALPQCTATIPVKEAVQHWNCVPLVLIGYLNQLMLDPICVYHSLSLNFVEHLLHIKLPEKPASAKEMPPAALPTSATAAASAATTAPKKKRIAPLDLCLRVEVVYGCRAEAYYCTDFICRGSCVLRMTEGSKTALKGYEEKLRALARLRLAAPQLIPRLGSGGAAGNSGTPPPPPPPRNCNGCGHPLQYRCTTCGADVCGMPMCVGNAVVGYPRACTRHVLSSSAAPK